MADGEAVEIGIQNDASSTTELKRVFDSQASPVFKVSAPFYSGPGTGATCVYGTSADGTGVRGDSAGRVGVHGKSDTDRGVFGESDEYIGVHGHSGKLVGVKGEGVTSGVEGESVSGFGVKGRSEHAHGIEGYSSQSSGVSGSTDDPQSSGVFGHSTVGRGVEGQSATKEGVYGSCRSGKRPSVYGVGLKQGSVGVEGESSQGTGVIGRSEAIVGVLGIFGKPARLKDVDYSGRAVLGNSTAIGCSGISEEGIGVDGYSPEGVGVRGTSKAGLAGYFQGNVLIEGSLTKTGEGSCVAVQFPDGSYRRLHSIESPESWFEDFGEGRLVKGKAAVRIDPAFANAVNLSKNGYHVFLTAHSTKIRALAVVARRADGFHVEDATGGSGTFSYRIVARRKGVRARRLERVRMPAASLRSQSPKAAAKRQSSYA